LRGRTMACDNTIYHELENTRMIRTGRWKLTVRHPDGPDELYDMDNDPEEAHDLIHSPEQEAVKKELRQKLERFFATFAEPKYDRWKGGATKGTEILRER